MGCITGNTEIPRAKNGQTSAWPTNRPKQGNEGIDRAGPEPTLARGPEGKEIRLENNTLPLSLALDRAIHDCMVQMHLAGYLRRITQ